MIFSPDDYFSVGISLATSDSDQGETSPIAVISDVTKGSFYMVLEYMEHDLAGLLKHGIDFKPQGIMCLAQQLFRGVSGPAGMIS